MFMYLLFSFYFSRSVSAVGGTQSIFTNPAGLSNYYSSFIFSYNLKDSSYLYGVNLYGIGIFKDKFSSTFAFSTSFKGFSFGIDYNDISKKMNFGLLYRPLSFFSFGYYKDIYSFTIRPLNKSYLELSLDAYYKDTFYLKTTSIGLNLKNFLAFVNYEFDRKNYSFGISFALENVLLSAKNDSNLAFELTFDKLPSQFKRKFYNKIDVKSYKEDKVPFLSKNFYEFISDLEEKIKNPSIKGFILNLSNLDLNLAQIEELRNLIKQSKKEFICYADDYDYKSYYLATACSKIFINKNGIITFSGLYMKRRYYKELFDSLGIVPQFEHYEEYKSAIEPYVRNSASEYDREQRERILKITYEKIKEDILSSRKIENLDSLFNYGIFINSDLAKKLKLVDDAVYENEFLKNYKISKEKKYISYEWENQFRPKIALVFLEGPIIDQDIYNVFDKSTTIGKNAVRLFEKIRNDKSIKAVIIRVNSPGGSAFTSDLITNEIKKLSKEKLVIVSMGRVAASGGYYISAYANKIFADNLTITGSIGILGGFLALDPFYKKKLYLNSDVFKIFEHSDVFSGRVLDSLELNSLREELKYGYDRFLSVVSEGRKISIDSVRKIAKGRVWIGKDAKEIGIIDTIGGILSAVNYAKSKYKNAEIVIYTRKFNFDYNFLPFSILFRMLKDRILYYDDWDY
ncbi:MAG: S49 family peptidase [Candidatus Hydrothermia bacterium]|nr:S49 family peptidase [Candidatus Hydrothermia bacterium]